MRVGTKVVVQPARLVSKRPGIHIDARQVSAALYAPRGASGQVHQVSDNGTEFLVEPYWNASARPGAGDAWYIWVNREWFGQLLAP